MGNIFDKYVIETPPIGEGAFGVVYRAADTKLKVGRALKFLHPALSHDANAVSNFVREAQQVAKLTHANIITVYDVVQDESRYAIVMNLATGGSLAQRLANDGPMTPQYTLAILRQVVAGLSYAHKQEVIHCDIKPQNILFDGEGNALLSDFGLAKLQSAQISNSANNNRSSSQQMRGTYAYIAPEMWDESPPSKQTDSYALACTVYEMLIGRVLFQGSTPMAILRQHAKGADLSAIQNDGIRAALTKALAPDPSSRSLPHQLLDEFEQAIQASGKPTTSSTTETAATAATAPPKDDDEKKPKPSEGNRLAWVKRAIGVAVVCIGSIWGISRLMPSPISPPTPSPRLTITVVATNTRVPATLTAVPPTFTPAPTVTVMPPKSATDWYKSGDDFFFKRDYDRAMADYSKAIELNPNNPDYWKSRGVSYWWKKDYDRAIADLSKAIELNPNN
nr:protein kinase [Anaerolineae bacterium]